MWEITQPARSKAASNKHMERRARGGPYPLRDCTMKALIAASSLMLALAIPSFAGASELKPMQGGSFELGTQNISIYYTVSGDAYEVVTTIAPEYGTPGTPIRFVSLLDPGQIETVSVGSFGADAANATLELVHGGDRLLVGTKTKTAELN